jgi:hypothetical protein
MVLATVEAEGLTPGHAYTLWFVVFNNPAGCTPPECGEDDIFDGDDLNADGIVAAQIAIGNATGNVAKADGTAEFGARLKSGVDSPGHDIVFTPADFGGEGVHLLNVSGEDAEVHLVVQTHGQARGGSQLLDQLTYLEAACTPGCADIQFSVHLP